MHPRLFLALLPLLVLQASLTLAQTSPRQLNTLPTVADSVRRPASAPVAAPPVETTRYSVGLKNGQTYRVDDVEPKQPLFGRAFLLLDGQQRIDLSEVKYYEDETGHYVRTTLPRSSREATLRRDKAGRISLYSATSSQYMGGSPGGFSPYGYGGGYGGYGTGGYRTVKTEYFTKDNGPVQDMSLKNLRLATADNPASTALLLQARSYQHYTTASYVLGAGLLIAGLAASLQAGTSGPALSPLTYAALPFMIVPVVVQSKQQRNIKQAISLYNRGPQ